jgi:hypothetical protein
MVFLTFFVVRLLLLLDSELLLSVICCVLLQSASPCRRNHPKAKRNRVQLVSLLSFRRDAEACNPERAVTPHDETTTTARVGPHSSASIVWQPPSDRNAATVNNMTRLPPTPAASIAKSNHGHGSVTPIPVEEEEEGAVGATTTKTTIVGLASESITTKEIAIGKIEALGSVRDTIPTVMERIVRVAVDDAMTIVLLHANEAMIGIRNVAVMTIIGAAQTATMIVIRNGALGTIRNGIRETIGARGKMLSGGRNGGRRVTCRHPPRVPRNPRACGNRLLEGACWDDPHRDDRLLRIVLLGIP